jgi:hypothetical protein
VDCRGRKRYRNPRADLQEVTPEKRRVVGASASDQHDQPYAALLERIGETGDAAALVPDCAFKRSRLLLNFREH